MQNNIPKIIIQTWKDNEIPIIYKDNVENIKKLNCEYEYIFFTDNDIEKFLKINYYNYYEIYCKLPFKIQKIDFFRYIVLYHYGGFYLDIDYKPIIGFDDNLLTNKCIFPIDTIINEEKYNINRYKLFKENNMNFLLGQYAFACNINNDFLKYIIDDICSNIENIIKNVNLYKNNHEIYVYITTGPDFVTKKYIEYKNKNDVTILDNGSIQCFGKYGEHISYGSWKNFHIFSKIIKDVSFKIKQLL